MTLFQLYYLGNAVFNLKVSEYLISQNISEPSDLQQRTLFYTTHQRKHYFIFTLEKNNFLNKKELDLVRRCSDYISIFDMSNFDPFRNRASSSFSSLIGYLYVNDKNRLNEVFDYVINL